MSFGVYRWFFSAPPTLKAQARTAMEAMEAMVAGDTRTLVSMASTDGASSGWAPENERKVYDQIINPFWAKLPRVGKPITQDFTGQAVAFQQYRLPNDLFFTRAASLFEEEEERGTISACDNLIETFHAMVVAEEGMRAKGHDLPLAIVRGIQKYGAELKRMGITALVARNPSLGASKVTTLDQSLINAQKRLDKAMQG